MVIKDTELLAKLNDLFGRLKSAMDSLSRHNSMHNLSIESWDCSVIDSLGFIEDITELMKEPFHYHTIVDQSEIKTTITDAKDGQVLFTISLKDHNSYLKLFDMRDDCYAKTEKTILEEQLSTIEDEISECHMKLIRIITGSSHTEYHRQTSGDILRELEDLIIQKHQIKQELEDEEDES